MLNPKHGFPRGPKLSRRSFDCFTTKLLKPIREFRRTLMAERVKLLGEDNGAKVHAVRLGQIAAILGLGDRRMATMEAIRVLGQVTARARPA